VLNVVAYVTGCCPTCD